MAYSRLKDLYEKATIMVDNITKFVLSTKNDTFNDSFLICNNMIQYRDYIITSIQDIRNETITEEKFTSLMHIINIVIIIIKEEEHFINTIKPAKNISVIT
jgi:hypothetical protein